MSTQSTPSIPFTYTHPQQNYRLLELPPALLELLTSENPPTLLLKSSAPSPSATTPRKDASNETEGGHVHLCTPTQTFQLRQVQSSNSVFLVKPSPFSAPLPGDDGRGRGMEIEDAGAGIGVTVVGQCNTTLEAFPVVYGARGMLEGVLPVYDQVDGQCGEDVDVEGVESGGDRRGKADIFADLPLSEAECERAWRESCAFEDRRGCAGRLSATVRLAVWKSMLAATTANGIDLCARFEAQDVLDALGEGEGLLEALVRAVLGVMGVGHEEGNSIEQNKCVRWVGETLLESSAPSETASIPTTTFKENWMDLLPEAWRGEARLEVLSGVYQQPTAQTICFSKDVSAADGIADASAKAATGNAGGKGARKWHEKFKNTKR